MEAAYCGCVMNELVGGERFVGVEEAVEEVDVQAATYIVAGKTVVVVIANGGAVAGGTPVHPSRGWWDQNGDVVDDTGTVDSRDIEASRSVPLAGQEGEGRVDTRKADYIPLVGDRCIEVGRTMPAGVHRVMRKRTMEK